MSTTHTTDTTQPTVYTIDEVAEILRVNRDLVRDKIYADQWPHLKISQRNRVVTHDDLEAIFALLHTEPAAQAAADPSSSDLRRLLKAVI